MLISFPSKQEKNSNAFFCFFRRILLVDTADEFYCAMGQLSAEMMEFTKEDSDKLIKVFFNKKSKTFL